MSSGSEFDILKDWTCEICLKSAKDPLALEYQLLPRNNIFLGGSNGEKLLFCTGWRLSYHLICVENLPRDITEQDIGPDSLCSDSGWFLPGSYDSDRSDHS